MTDTKIVDRRSSTKMRLEEEAAAAASYPPMPPWFRRSLAIAMMQDAEIAAETGKAPPLPPHYSDDVDTHDAIICPRCLELAARAHVTLSRRES